MTIKHKVPKPVALVEGNEDDGWNVMLKLSECGHGIDVEIACEDAEDARVLAELLEDAAWFAVHKR